MGGTESRRHIYFGEWVSGIRKTLGLSQKEFADELNSSKREIRRIEASKCKPRGELVLSLHDLLSRKLIELGKQYGELSPDELSPAHREEWRKISQRLDRIKERVERLDADPGEKPDEAVRLAFDAANEKLSYYLFYSDVVKGKVKTSINKDEV